MTDEERKVQEAVGSLKVDETRRVYDIQYIGPKDRDPGFLITVDGEQIPLTGFDDVIEYFGSQTNSAVWHAFVPDNNDDGEVVRDRVKHIEITVKVTHTDV